MYFLRIGLLTGLFLFLFSSSRATHLMGGDLTYTFNSVNAAGSFYDVKLIVYRYCDTTNGVPALLDTSMMLGIFVNQNNSPPNLIYWNTTFNLPLLTSTFVSAPPGNSNCTFQPTACVERGEYRLTIFLPNNQTGYHMIVERCCRNGNIINLDLPGAVGMTFYSFIPAGIFNSSPQISDVSVPYICSNDTTTIINNAFDPDGDSLAYSFVVPYAGTSGTSSSSPDPIDSSPYAFPITPVIYAPGYNQTIPFGIAGYASINPVNGMTKYFIPNQGLFVVAIQIREFRNGVLIGSTRRDLQFITIVCPPNPLPLISSTNSNNVYTIAENQQLCFDVTATDSNGDSLFLFAEGPLLNPAMVNPPGVMADASGAGSVTSTFCWTPVCGMSQPAPYEFFVTVVDNGCPPKSNSQVFSVFVTGGAPTVIPTVTIHDNPGIICLGEPVMLFATCNLPGTSPFYTWSVNGLVVPSVNDSIFISSSLVNGDVVTVTVVSNASCLITDTATSPPFAVNISSQPSAQVSISAYPVNLCPLQNCTYTASVTNGGNNPTYQWYLNGNASGANQVTYAAATAGGVLSVYVVVTPSTGCLPQTSNTITNNVGPLLNPFVSINASVVDSICPGQEVRFVAYTSNTGTPPTFDWLSNGTSMGAIDNDTIFLNNINDGDVIQVAITSNYSCVSTYPTYSNQFEYHFYPDLQIALTDGPIEVCNGSPVVLEAGAIGGNTESIDYLWSAGNSASQVNTFIPEVTGYYFATVDDHCNVPATDSVFIQLLPTPTSDFHWTPELPSIFMPEVTFTDASIDAMQWHWDFGDQFTSTEQNPLHTYTASGNFPVALVTTNNLGCTDTLIKILEMEHIVTVYVPNSFTPNGDGKNDEFEIFTQESTNYSISIYNRWGQEFFTSDSKLNGWNGLDQNGKDAPSGSYVYKVKVEDATVKKTYFGTVMLIR